MEKYAESLRYVLVVWNGGCGGWPLGCGGGCTFWWCGLVLGLLLWECVAGCGGGCWRGWTAGWVLVILVIGFFDVFYFVG
jgi:hypothetical protein